MKAFVIHKPGGIENLLLSDVEKPVAADDGIVIATRAISINPVDIKLKYADEGLNMICGPERPITLGWDIAGEVDSVGKNVTDYKVGDRVFGMVNFPGHGKVYAEYVAAPADHLAHIPEGTSFEEAAATTLAALTALQVLSGRIKAEDKILIHAGSGGVGHFAVQIAKSMGAHVTATSSAKNRDFVMSLGADRHIDYRTEAFEQVLSDLDFVFDTQGGETLEKSFEVLRTGGQIMSIAAMGMEDEMQAKAAETGKSFGTILVQSNRSDMKQLADMLAAGTLRPNIHATFPFNDLPAAHTEVETGRSVGKVIVTV